MVPSAREVYQETVKILSDRLPEELLKTIGEKIIEARDLGKGNVTIVREKIGIDKGTDGTKLMRMLETYMRSKGYQVTMGYGCLTMDVKWL